MLTAIAAAALIVSGAEEPSDPDGVVATARGGTGSVLVGAVAPTSDASPDAAAASRVTTQNLTTQEQIDRWISARSDVEPFANEAEDDRRVHGFASVGVGTNDYSSFAVGVSMPIGENGRVDLSYSETKNGYGYPGYGYSGYGYGSAGYGYGLGYHARPFGAGAFSNSGRSRSMSLGFRWDEDKDRDDRRIRLPSAEN